MTEGSTPEVDVNGLSLLRYPDRRLRQQCARVTEITPLHTVVVERMQELLGKTNGLALAANQVGFMEQMVVVKRNPNAGKDEEFEYDVWYNPTLVRKDEIDQIEEFCLSLPRVTTRIERANVIMVEVMKPDGGLMRFEATGIKAQMWQHEIDHLNGVLTIDHLEGVRKTLVEGKLKKLRREAKHRKKGTVRNATKRRPKKRRGKKRR